MHRADLTTFMCRLPRNVGNFNLVEPYGPFQASRRIAFTHMFVEIKLQCRLLSRSLWPSGLRRRSGIACSNPAGGMDVCRVVCVVR